MRESDEFFSATEASNAGLVLGIDVGCSPKRRTTCFATLSWDWSSIALQFRLTTSDPQQHRLALAELVGSKIVGGVAIDGPLAKGFRLVRNYRTAEAILSRGVLQKRGKPGQTSVPVGQNLHAHATRLAEMVLRTLEVVPSCYPEAICERSIVEAFPNLYLAAMVDEARIPILKRNASDVYWGLLVTETNVLAQHLTRLLPGRELRFDLPAIQHHDHRAGFVCALTALSLVLGQYVAVGDACDGEIILPGETYWGVGPAANAWLAPVLRRNLADVLVHRSSQLDDRVARVRTHLGPW